MWQPFETAPKDGRSILVYMKNQDPGEEYSVIQWSDLHRSWQLVHTGTYAVDGDVYDDPTHWMSLPEPPDGSQP
jgi:hypothetical protein